jgi:hypothetical protein
MNRDGPELRSRSVRTVAFSLALVPEVAFPRQIDAETL